MITVINKTKNGRIYKCNECNSTHIEYKNLNFSFTSEQYSIFLDYISDLETTIDLKEKIIIWVDKNLKITLNNNELLEFKALLKIIKIEVKNETLEVNNFIFNNCLN